jgi:hypothetical protein
MASELRFDEVLRVLSRNTLTTEDIDIGYLASEQNISTCLSR